LTYLPGLYKTDSGLLPSYKAAQLLHHALTCFDNIIIPANGLEVFTAMHSVSGFVVTNQYLTILSVFYPPARVATGYFLYMIFTNCSNL
jgi:hypothetical protein